MKRRQIAGPAATTVAATPAAAPEASTTRLEWLFTAGLLAVTCLTYYPVVNCGFINYDDNVYVTERPELTHGLTGPSLRWACTAEVSGNWHPLTLLSLVVDQELSLHVDHRTSGPKPWVFHLTNLLLHLANTVLCFRCLRVMTGAIGRSAVVAALFALHPLHVEAVAWVSDRTDLLSTFFGLLALRAYLWYAAAPSHGRMAVVTGLLVLSFLAKPTWVTFPFLLLLLDFWPLRRAAAGESWRRLTIEKLPLFAVVVAGSVVALLIQRHVGALEARHSFAARAGNAVVSYAEYLRQTFVPTDLAISYPHPGDSLGVGAVLGATALLIAVSAVVIAFRCPHPEWFVGWFWFVGTLLPLIGLVQFREEARADRYTYVAHIGLFLALTWAAADLVKELKLSWLGPLATGVVLLICVLYSRVQIMTWQDSRAVWDQAIRVTTNNARAHNQYGEALFHSGRIGAAREQFDAYIRLRPNEARGYRHRGNTWVRFDRDRAAEDYETALRIDPNLPDMHFNLGLIRQESGKLDEAAEHFRKVLDCGSEEIKAMAWQRLGTLHEVTQADALARAGKYSEAIAVLDRTFAGIDPDNNPNFVRSLRDRRQCFERSQPYRAE
jgi:hypothetical protein